MVGAKPRWVQNAHAVLGLKARYHEAGAKTLGLARQLNEQLRIPLVEAYPIARKALAAWPARGVWEREDPTGIVTLRVDVARYLSGYAARLALARNWYAEKKRGRSRKSRKRGIAAAREYGIDLTLLEESLKRTPEERLRELEEATEFFRSATVV